MAKCHVIAFSGGDCGGKSSCLPIIKKDLKSRGYVVLVAEEAATELMQKGIHWDVVGVPSFQRLVLQQMLAKEDVLRKAAERIHEKTNKEVVILCNHGTMDAAGFTTPEDFRSMLAEFKQTIVDLRDIRYDAVIFMRSVAVDAPHLYTCEGNPDRDSSVSRAAELDERLLAAWLGHPHMRIIDNSTKLEEKYARALAVIHASLGIGGSLEIEDKYLVTGLDIAQLPKPSQAVQIVQYYLKTDLPEGVERIRARGQGDTAAYYHTVKRWVSPGVCEEYERQMSYQEFEVAAMERAEPSLGEVLKTRHYFVWKNQYFELDVFDNPKGLMLLEIEKLRKDDVVELPDFLTGKLQNVTHDKGYSNYQIARRLAQVGPHSF